MTKQQIECKRCGLYKETCEMQGGDDWVSNCMKVKGQEHDFGEQQIDWRSEFRQEKWHVISTDKDVDEIADWWINKFISHLSEVKESVEGMKKDEHCDMVEDLGYHGKDCWDGCHEKQITNKIIDSISHLLSKKISGIK